MTKTELKQALNKPYTKEEVKNLASLNASIGFEDFPDGLTQEQKKTYLKEYQSKIEKQEQEQEPITAEQVEQAFKVLCSKILSVRTEYKNLPNLINRALHLALKDYISFNNKNSLKVLITLKQDKKSVYNLPYVKEYLENIGLFLKYNPVEEALTVREFKDFNPEQALNSSFLNFRAERLKELNEQRKKEVEQAHKKKEQALKDFLSKHNFNGSIAEALEFIK